MNIFPDGLQHPIIFWFLCLVICIGIWLFYFKKGERNFWDIDLLRQIYKRNIVVSKIAWWLLIGISLCFALLLSLPYHDNSTETIVKDGIDIEIVLDLSYSMNATDLRPSRLEVSKQVLQNFVWELQSDRVGMILFSGKPFQSVPLTFDYDFLEDFIWDISDEMINQNNPDLAGTAIWDALILAADTLEKDAPDREKIIILLTDGEANKWLDPLLSLKFLQEKNIKTYTIWVWKDQASFVEVVTLWGFVQRVPIWPVDEETLKKIANTTQWEYFRADSDNSFERILESIARLEKSEIEYETMSFHTPAFWLIILLLFLQFGALWYIVYYKWIRL